MKKMIFAAFVASLICVLFSSCGKKVDPIHGTVPVDSTFHSGFPLHEFHAAGESGDTVKQKALVDQYRKQLTKNVIDHYPCVQETNVRFVLGSGFAKDVKSGDGKTYSGKFKNELIIIINDPCKKDTLFLACGNGMLSPLDWSSQSDWGSGVQCRFVIKKGEGIAHYKPQLEEWASVAGDLQIPIRDAKGKLVSQEVFLNYLGKYEGILFEGDVLDLCAGKVFNKAGQEVDFSRRIAETQKANKELAKKQTKSKKSSQKNKRK